jgi:uncharacterized membrane protein YkoI
LPGAFLAGLLGTGLAGDHDEAHRLRESGVVLPLQALIARDPMLSTARVLEVELEQGEGRYRYEIEYLDTDGRVWKGHFDAATGQRLRTERED